MNYNVYKKSLTGGNDYECKFYGEQSLRNLISDINRIYLLNLNGYQKWAIFDTISLEGKAVIKTQVNEWTVTKIG